MLCRRQLLSPHGTAPGSHETEPHEGCNHKGVVARHDEGKIVAQLVGDEAQVEALIVEGRGDESIT